ncbi:unnamed protein product [Rotaria socialis]|uniref:Uncharacterized protein n=1 Tax=Rotaria socialis TaxID=392032 RepID=A0A820GQS5_9BILA|nr:unnamed protein product [Rotaria socialis]CAF4281729.1 unnamed protein product [Rotaria socialis]
MDIVVVCLFALLSASRYPCLATSCKTNCTNNEECWREALAYRSSELIKQLFSFSSLAVHVDTFQREHSSELNNSIAFINRTLENYLSAESTANNLTMDLFKTAKKLLIDHCANLTVKPIESIKEMPSLTCTPSSCFGNKLSFKVILIITILITSLMLVICTVQFFQTYKRTKASKSVSPRLATSNSTSINNTTVASKSSTF